MNNVNQAQAQAWVASYENNIARQEIANLKAADQILNYDVGAWLRTNNVQREQTLHIRKIPMKKAYDRLLQTIDPIFKAKWYDQNRDAIKKNIYFSGKKVKEGRKKYKVTDLVHGGGPGSQNALPQIRPKVAMDKDAYKAAMMYSLCPSNLLTADEIGRAYISSKGFSKVFLGRQQKDKKQFRKKYRKKSLKASLKPKA